MTNKHSKNHDRAIDISAQPDRDDGSCIKRIDPDGTVRLLLC